MGFLGISFGRRGGRPRAVGAAPVRPVGEIAPWFGTDTALLSDAGPVRGNNEDYVLALSQAVPGFSMPRTYVAALADGMGGHLAGETASRIAVESALDLYRRATGEDPAGRLTRAIERANEAVLLHAQTSPDFEGMGTTLVLLSLTDAGAYCAWVGDSRLYRWRGGRIELLTCDDTLVRELLDQGILQPHEALRHPDSFVLSQAIGTKPVLRRINLIGPVDMAAGDCFLMCSDGLHDVVPEELMAEVLGRGDANEIARGLLAQAIAHNADDNISSVVIRIKALAEASALARETAVLPRSAP